MNRNNKEELLGKKRIFRNFIILAFSFLFLGIMYIHLVVLRTKSLLLIKKLENKKKKNSIKYLEIKDEYIKKSNLNRIKEKAKSELEMFYPESVKYFKLK